MSARDPSEWQPVLDAILEGVQVIGFDFRYLHLNETAARHGRSSKGALLGRTMMECYPGIEQAPFFPLLQRCLADRTPALLENEFTFPDGSKGDFELRIEPVPLGASVLSLDVTARKQAERARADAEERLRLAQRMEAVGQLAAGIAHDFNNLLTVILGQGEQALDRPQGPTREDVELILEATRSSAELTRALLAYGRRTPMERQPLLVAEVVRGLERILRRSLESRIELRLELGPDLPGGGGPAAPVEADRSQLEQVLLNLVLNARDAISGPGRITVSVSQANLDEEYVSAFPDARRGPHTVLSVSDTGVGMDAAIRARIFEPFFTTKDRGRGTGLGLATVYGIVRQTGGNVWVYSEPGKGSTFKVYLPSSERAAVAAPAPVPPAPAPTALAPRPAAIPAGQGFILLVEDAPLLRKLLEAALGRAGYPLLMAAGGEEALALWDSHPGEVALVVTDVMMPGMTGTELIRRLRLQRPELPVICTSGYADSQLTERGVMPPDVVFLEKPFSSRVLVDRVQSMLRPG